MEIIEIREEDAHDEEKEESEIPLFVSEECTER